MFKIDQFIDGDQIVNHGTFRMLSTPDTDMPDSLVYCEDIYHLEKALSNNNVSTIFTSSDLLRLVDTDIKKGVVISASPKVEYWQLHNRLTNEEMLKPDMDFGIGSNCLIHPSAVISKKTMLGDNVIVGAHAVIEDYSIIGDNTTIGSGVVIGAAGLQAIYHNGKRVFIRHAGGVKIGRDVKIMANTVVQKAVRPKFTQVGDNCLISILVSIGHGCQVGNNCIFAGNAFIGGGVIIGDNVSVGPSATVKDGLTISSNAQVKLGSVVVKDVEEGGIISGNFALSHVKNLKDYARKLKK